MTTRSLRRIAFLTLLSFTASVLAPTALAATEAGRPQVAEGVSDKLAAKLYPLVRRIFEGTLARANRSDRVQLKLNFSFMDERERMLFDISGLVRVRIKNEKRRAEFAKMAEKEETKVLSTNGPLSIDAAVSPVAVEGQDVVFGVHLDITILTKRLFQELVRSGAQVVGVVGLNVIGGKLLEALTGFSVETAGKAVEMGVENLSALIGGEAGAITYATFQDEEHKSWREKLKATLTPGGLVKHFGLAVIFAAVTGGMRFVGMSVGAAIGTALLPTGGGVIGVVAATGALVWFGNFVVETVGVKWPVLWRLAKIGRLYRKAVEAEGDRQDKLVRKYQEYVDHVLRKVTQEIESGYKRWSFLELTIRYFRRRVRSEGPLANNLEGFDLVPYQPLIDGIAQRLQFLLKDDQDWYAGRMYFQLTDAVNQLPAGHDHRPTPGEILEEYTEGAHKSLEDRAERAAE